MRVALAAAFVGGAAALGSGCVAVLGDFGDKDLPEPNQGGGGATGTGGMGGMGVGGAATGGMGGTGGEGGGGGMGGAGGMGGMGGAGGAEPTGCPATGKGPAMVQVPGPNGVDFCIDATEVSVEQYNAWLTGNPDPANQGSECAPWNASFVPSTDATNFCNYFDYPAVVANNPKRPIRCVDWCDAEAFCAWAGKRLCGSIGGGSNAFDNPADPDQSEWFRACSQAGTRDFPYADLFDEKACIGAEYDGNPAVEPGKDYPRDVGSTASCEGGFPGIFDMSGNIEEWEGSCNGSNGKDDACLTRGGSFTHLEGDLMCASNVGTTRGTTSIIIGFRCCADFK